MEKRFWIIIGIIIAVFAGIMLLGNKKDNSDSGGDSSAKPTSHVLGKTDSGVKLVEYGDYQCPYCGLFHPVVKQVIDKYKDQISFQFRHYPLNQVHENAFAAARAAEAAGEQDKFWEMHNMLFENQEAWSKRSNANIVFEGYAEQLSLDLTKFKKDFASSAINARINADKAEFNKTKETPSTPTFFLNGKKIQPEYTLDSFSKIIDEALAKANKDQN